MNDYRTERVASDYGQMEIICRAQRKQKEFYDRDHSEEVKYQVGEKVMVYMPGDVSGKRWKIARPYHGSYRI